MSLPGALAPTPAPTYHLFPAATTDEIPSLTAGDASRIPPQAQGDSPAVRELSPRRDSNFETREPRSSTPGGIPTTRPSWRRRAADDRDPARGEDKALEEYYGQLWALPAERTSSRVLDQDPSSATTLVWIRRDLFVAKTFTAADCFVARHSDRFACVPKTFRFAKDFWSRIHGHATFADILRRNPMESGRGGNQGGTRGGRGRRFQKKGGFRNPYQYNRAQQAPPPSQPQAQVQNQEKSMQQNHPQLPQGQMTESLQSQTQQPQSSIQAQSQNQQIPLQFQQAQMGNQAQLSLQMLHSRQLVSRYNSPMVSNSLNSNFVSASNSEHNFLCSIRLLGKGSHHNSLTSHRKGRCRANKWFHLKQLR
ncbi:hypothetical protein BRADI_2g11564v3 [Brachypodium distachyon]|uniref:Uncharacterized protein n=1 Tax=Brachypodium distachyon TaxID=15368 RepID=A0A2K2D813_BRADI|nr:hypothetical protein BRADI_2g11564v3 [Brachypodium distachyon]